MRIALYTTGDYYTPSMTGSIPSGCTVYTRGLSKALIKKGHEVTVLAHRWDWSDSAIPDQYDFEGSTVRILPAAPNKWERSESVHAYLTANPHDVIEAHHIEHPLLVEQMVGGTPTVTRHASDFLDSVAGGTYQFWKKPGTLHATARQAEWSQHVAEMLQVRNSDLVLTAGQKQYQKTRQMGVHNVQELPLGIDEVDEELNDESQRNKVFVMIARLHDPRKGGEYLLSIVNNVPKEYPVVVLAECSDEEASRLQDQALREFEFLNKPVSDGALIRLYQDAALTIVPTKSESFGLVLLEPMARGSFVASWDSGDPSKANWPIWSMGSHLNPGPAFENIKKMTETAFDPPTSTPGAGRAAVRDFAATYLWENLIERYELAYYAAIARSIGRGRTRGL